MHQVLLLALGQSKPLQVVAEELRLMVPFVLVRARSMDLLSPWGLYSQLLVRFAKMGAKELA